MFLKGFIIFACVAQSLAVWQCRQDAECSSLSGSSCVFGECLCPAGMQPGLSGRLCVPLAPYLTSSCVETHQCSRLVTAYECRNAELNEGTCACQANHHYFQGRCWATADFGQPCVHDEECLGQIRDMFSLSCNGTCVCADGYYLRQRGECRRRATVGEGCVLDEDCQFEGGACDATELTCYNVNSATRETSVRNLTISRSSLRNTHSISCRDDPCPEPFQCYLDTCVCPRGFYYGDNGQCLAELGTSVSSPEQCQGFFTQVVGGVCTCQPNFFFDENMRDCVKVSRKRTDSCLQDAACHTFGAAALCGPPQQWGVRTCACDADLAVWDEDRQMCRLFAGVGEPCEVDSDCLAGEFEIQCVVNDEGAGVCTCPEGYTEVDGLCLTTGLQLGDVCQLSLECTATANSACVDGRCACDSAGYQEVDGTCAPIIGGICEENSDCTIEKTVCVNSTQQNDVFTCQCQPEFVEYDDECWPVSGGFEAACDVSAQCTASLGQSASCNGGRCACDGGHHFRDGNCWPVTGLFEACSRSSQCYLADITERVVCRNSLCQCDFKFPYSEQLNTCTTDGASSLQVTVTLMFATLVQLLMS